MLTTDKTTQSTNSTQTAFARVALVAVAMLLAFVSFGMTAPGAHAAGGWDWTYDNDKGCYRVASGDTDGNGYGNLAWWDLTGDCRWDSVSFDTNGDDRLQEQLWSDADQDGRWDFVFVDTDQQLGFDYLFVDYANNGNWQGQWLRSQEPQVLPTVVGGGNYDGQSNLLLTMARINGSVAY